MKRTRLGSLPALLLALTLVAGGEAKADTPAAAAPKRFDVSTFSGVASAMKALKGWELGADDQNCIQREGDAIVLVASFANDYGCRAEGYFADGYYHEAREASAPALKTLGWSDRSKREAIALRWANAMTSPTGLSAAEKDPPRAKLQADGSVIVEGWNVRPVGMVPTQTSLQLRITFSDAGDAKVETLKTVTTKLGGSR